MPCLERRNATKRDTGGHILTEWPFCHVKSAIEHKRRYAHQFLTVLHEMSGLLGARIKRKISCIKCVSHAILKV
jgi:hypothetical protein